MTDERDWYAMNDMQCTDTYAGWRCVLGQGHSGQHRANAAKPESDALSILQDLIAELRAYEEDRETTEWLLDSRGECLCDGETPDVDRCTLHNTRQVTSMADRAEARLREVEDE